MSKATKITQVTPDVCRMLRPELETVLGALEDTHGLKATVGNAKYTSGSVTFQVTLAVVTEDGTVRSPEAEAYKAFASMYGLPEDGLGKTYADYTGRRFRVTGLNTRRGKYPVLVEDLQGKRFKQTAEAVKAFLDREAANGGAK